MRPIFLAIMTLVVLLVLGGIILLRPHSKQPAAAASEPIASTQASDVAPAKSVPSVVTVPAAAVTVSPEEHQTGVEAEVSRLADLSGKSDPASIAIILNDLKSSDKEVRMEAIEAIKQSDNTNAIPTLLADASSAPDLETQEALQQAADFLSLPDANLVATAPGTPDTPEQAQAAQQKFAATQNLRTSGKSDVHGRLNTSPAPETAPSGN